MNPEVATFISKRRQGSPCVGEKKKRLSKLEKNQNVTKNAIKKVGADTFNQVMSQWNKLETGQGGADRKKGDGMILTLFQLGLSSTPRKLVV